MRRRRLLRGQQSGTSTIPRQRRGPAYLDRHRDRRTAVISYHDQTAGALKVAKCGNAACTVGNAITAVDDHANNVGLFTSIAIGTDGLPVISYRDHTVLRAEGGQVRQRRLLRRQRHHHRR